MGRPGPDPEITLEEVLAVFKALDDTCTPLTTPEVAEALDCPRRTAYKKLQQLADDGAIKTKSVGANARVWWLPNRRS